MRGRREVVRADYSCSKAENWRFGGGRWKMTNFVLISIMPVALLELGITSPKIQLQNWDFTLKLASSTHVWLDNSNMAEAEWDGIFD